MKDWSLPHKILYWAVVGPIIAAGIIFIIFILSGLLVAFWSGWGWNL